MLLSGVLCVTLDLAVFNGHGICVAHLSHFLSLLVVVCTPSTVQAAVEVVTKGLMGKPQH